MILVILITNKISLFKLKCFIYILGSKKKNEEQNFCELDCLWEKGEMYSKLKILQSSTSSFVEQTFS